MAQQSLHVCYWGNSGRHLLAASISPLDPKAVISHNASIARLYLGLLFSSAAEQGVLAAA